MVAFLVQLYIFQQGIANWGFHQIKFFLHQNTPKNTLNFFREIFLWAFSRTLRGSQFERIINIKMFWVGYLNCLGFCTCMITHLWLTKLGMRAHLFALQCKSKIADTFLALSQSLWSNLLSHVIKMLMKCFIEILTKWSSVKLPTLLSNRAP